MTHQYFVGIKDPGIELYGSDKQIKWATSVINNLRVKYPDVELPQIDSADFWIKARNKTIEEILASKEQIYTPFTAVYPRYGREDAIHAVKSLGDDFVVLDLETSGLKFSKEDIIEIAIVHYSGVTLMDTLVQPIYLDTYAKSRAIDITKITVDELTLAPTFDAIAPTLRDIVTSYHVVTFNTGFDMNFITYTYYKHGLEVPKIRATCAMKIASAYFGMPDINISLVNACKLLGIEQQEAHRAKADVMSTIELIKRIGESHE